MKTPGHYWCNNPKCDDVSFGPVCQKCQQPATFITDSPPAYARHVTDLAQAEMKMKVEPKPKINAKDWFARMRAAAAAPKYL